MAWADHCFSRLSKTRRKRAIPGDWASADNVQTFSPLSESGSLFAGARTLNIDSTGGLVLSGGDAGNAGVYNTSDDKLEQEFSISGPITSTLWAGSKTIVATTTGLISVFEEGRQISKFSAHAGEVTALARHPSGEILASVGVDKSFTFYDLNTSTQVLQIHTGSGERTVLFIT